MSFVGGLLASPKLPPSPIRLTESTTAPRNLLLGKTATAGTFLWHGLSDVDANDNRDFNRVFALAGHKVQRLTKVWAGSQLIYSGSLQHGVRTRMNAPKNDKGFHLVWVTFYDGRPGQAADPYLTGQQSDPNDAYMTTGITRPIRWTASDKVTGCGYVVITMRHERERLSSPLEFVFEVEGAALYDRRKDSTAGGTGLQRWSDPTSWVYSDNAAVAIDHYKLGIVNGIGNNPIIFGMGLNPWRIPYDEFEANADLCDEQVFGLSRYAVNGEIKADADHRDNIVKMAKAMAARPYDDNGRILIRPMQARAIKLTLTDADLVDGEAYDLSVSPGGEDLVNTIRGTFRDPNGRYADIDYPNVSDDDLISKDGRPFEGTLDLPLETNSARAQRLATIELEIQKRRDVIDETYMPIANILNVGDWFQRDSELRGTVSKVYEVLDKDVGEALTVKIKARETDPSVTAFGENQARPVDIPEPLEPYEIEPRVPPITIVTPSPSEGGGATIPSVRIDITRFVEGVEVDYFEFQYGISNGLTGDDLGIVEGREQSARIPDDGTTSYEVTGLLPGTEYVWRIRSVYDGVVSAWSDFESFTTTDALVATDLTGITNDAIRDELTGATAEAVAELADRQLEAGGFLANIWDSLANSATVDVDRYNSAHPTGFRGGLTGIVSDGITATNVALPDGPEMGTIVNEDGTPADVLSDPHERHDGAAITADLHRFMRAIEKATT